MPNETRPDLLSNEDVPSLPRQQRAIDGRERIVESALQLFGTQGFEGTSIEQIVGQAGVATGSFYHHFASKRQLLLCLMDDLLERLDRLELRPSPAAQPREALHLLLTRAFEQDLAFLGAFRAWQESVLSDPELATREREIREWTTARVMRVLESLQERGGARQGVDLPTLARVLDNFFWSLLAKAIQMETVELEAWIDATAHLVFHALFTDVVEENGG